MPIHKMLDSHDRRLQKHRRIEMRAKWAAILLSVALLAITLLFIHARRNLTGATALPASTSVELANPVTAR